MIELKEQVKQLLHKLNQAKPTLVESSISLKKDLQKQHYEEVVRPILNHIENKFWILILSWLRTSEE